MDERIGHRPPSRGQQEAGALVLGQTEGLWVPSDPTFSV